MKIRIAVPNAPIFKPFFEELENSIYKDSIDIVYVSEMKAAEMLNARTVDLSLLTPVAYSSIYKTLDLRILPTVALAARGYSELYNLSLKQGLKSINSIYFPQRGSYAEIISLIVLSERYELEPEKVVADKLDEKSIDAFFSYYGEDTGNFTIDLTEDWLDTFEFMLPIAFWVVPSEFKDLEILDLVNSIKEKDLQMIETVDEITDNQNYEPRQGEIQWQFDDEFEKALEETLDLLFYRFLIPELIDVKVFGRDYEKGSDDEL